MYQRPDFVCLSKWSYISNISFIIQLMKSLDQKHGNHLKKLGIQSFPQNCYQSLGYLTLVAEYFPNDLQTLEWKIKCLFELKQYDICLKNINENQYQSQEIQKIEFQIYLDQADFDSILNVSKRKLKIDDYSTRQLFKILKKIAKFYKDFEIYKKNSQIDSAVSSIENIIPLFPSQTVRQKLMSKIIDLLVEVGDLKKAVDFLERCPFSLLTCTKRILYHSYLLEQEKCMQLIKQGNQKFPNNMEIQQLQRRIRDQFFQYKISKLCLQYQKYSQVVVACNEGLKINPQNTKLVCLLKFNRGKAQKQLGNLQQALQDFHAVLNIDENLIECIQQRIYIYVELKKYHLAIYEYQILKVKNPANLMTYDQLIKNIQKLQLKIIKEGEVCKTISIIPFEQFNPPHIQQSDQRLNENIADHQRSFQWQRQNDEEESEQGQLGQQGQEQYQENQPTQSDDSDGYHYDANIRVSVPQYRPGVQKIKQR